MPQVYLLTRVQSEMEVMTMCTLAAGSHLFDVLGMDIACLLSIAHEYSSTAYALITARLHLKQNCMLEEM